VHSRILSELAGHDSSAYTVDVYGYVDVEAQEQAAHLLQNLLRGVPLRDLRTRPTAGASGARSRPRGPSLTGWWAPRLTGHACREGLGCEVHPEPADSSALQQSRPSVLDLDAHIDALVSEPVLQHLRGTPLVGTWECRAKPRLLAPSAS
jgi:hypothetical protein